MVLLVDLDVLAFLLLAELVDAFPFCASKRQAITDGRTTREELRRVGKCGLQRRPRTYGGTYAGTYARTYARAYARTRVYTRAPVRARAPLAAAPLPCLT